MSYVVDMTYYDTVKNIYSEQVTKNILLCCLSRYETMPERYRRTDDSYAKETMYRIHDELFKKDAYYDETTKIWNTIVSVRIEYVKNHCLGNYTAPFYVKEYSIHDMIEEYNKIPYYFKQYVTKK